MVAIQACSEQTVTHTALWHSVKRIAVQYAVYKMVIVSKMHGVALRS